MDRSTSKMLLASTIRLEFEINYFKQQQEFRLSKNKKKNIMHYDQSFSDLFSVSAGDR